MLHRRGAGLLTDFVHPRSALMAVHAVDANLDQRVRSQVAFDFGQDGRRQAVARDADHRMQVMCLGAQRASEVGGQVGHLMFQLGKGAILLS